VSADEIIVYKSSGVPIQDLVTAQHIERRAAARGLGQVVDLGGDHD
jgi:ornithine cyclodeaminase/alanine dehydrogenase-like protein (mu-crystallin family)